MLIVVAVVYVGMTLGSLPGLKLDRAAIALASGPSSNLMLIESLRYLIVINAAGWL